MTKGKCEGDREGGRRVAALQDPRNEGWPRGARASSRAEGPYTHVRQTAKALLHRMSGVPGRGRWSGARRDGAGSPERDHGRSRASGWGTLTLIQGDGNSAPAADRRPSARRERVPGEGAGGDQRWATASGSWMGALGRRAGRDRDADRADKHAPRFPAPRTRCLDWTLAQAGNEEVRSVNAVVGETNDAPPERHPRPRPPPAEMIGRAIWRN